MDDWRLTLQSNSLNSNICLSTLLFDPHICRNFEKYEMLRYIKVLILGHRISRHQMETFFALLALCAGNSQVTGKFPSQRPVTRSFDIFFNLCLNKRLSNQSRRRWLDTIALNMTPMWSHTHFLWYSVLFRCVLGNTIFSGVGTSHCRLKAY